MVKLLVYIKHHLNFIWIFIEWCNSLLFNILYGSKLQHVLPNLLRSSSTDKYKYKLLSSNDMFELEAFFTNQPTESYKFFNPHKFDERSLIKRNKDKSFIMIGTYCDNILVGYCFLRCFFNKQAFRGKIVDAKFQGKGIAKQMGILTSNICKALNLRLYATISKNNIKSIASSKAVNEIRVVKELENDYLYVEYLLK